MGLLTPVIPTLGQLNASEDVDIVSAFTALYGLVNGGLDDANITDGSLSAALAAGGVDDTKLASTLAAILGVSSGATVRRGKTNIATSEARTSAAYGLLATPDRVSGVVLPTDGLIIVGYRAQWSTSAVAPFAALFLGASQLKVPENTGGAGADIVTEASPSAFTVGIFGSLQSFAGGLASGVLSGTTAGAPATTGRAVYGFQGRAIEGGSARDVNGAAGGFCVIEAAAGTYDVSVQFKSASGTVTVKNRKLWVSTLGF